MKPSEATAVLAVAASFDRRTVGEADARAWAIVLEGVEPQDARDAVIEHYTESREFVFPADVLAIVRRRVREKSRDLPPVTPPRDLADNPKAEIAWTRVWQDAVLAGHTHDRARTIANNQFGIDEGEPLAIGSNEVDAALTNFRDAAAKSKPAMKPKPAIQRTPARWAADRGLQILDPDGWRDAGLDHREPCTRAVYLDLIRTSTTGPFFRETEVKHTTESEAETA